MPGWWTRRRSAAQRIYRVLPSGLQKLQAEIDRFWTNEMDLLVADAHRLKESP